MAKNCCKILIITLILIKFSSQHPTQLNDDFLNNHATESEIQLDDNGAQDDETEKGILDGVMGSSSSSTTAKPAGGLGGLPNFGQNVANAGPMLILGGFQAIVTKFDPAMIAGLPGLGGLGNVFPSSKASE